MADTGLVFGAPRRRFTIVDDSSNDYESSDVSQRTAPVPSGQTLPASDPSNVVWFKAKVLPIEPHAYASLAKTQIGENERVYWTPAVNRPATQTVEQMRDRVAEQLNKQSLLVGDYDFGVAIDSETRARRTHTDQNPRPWITEDGVGEFYTLGDFDTTPSFVFASTKDVDLYKTNQSKTTKRINRDYDDFDAVPFAKSTYCSVLDNETKRVVDARRIVWPGKLPCLPDFTVSYLKSLFSHKKVCYTWADDMWSIDLLAARFDTAREVVGLRMRNRFWRPTDDYWEDNPGQSVMYRPRTVNALRFPRLHEPFVGKTVIVGATDPTVVDRTKQHLHREEVRLYLGARPVPYLCFIAGAKRDNFWDHCFEKVDVVPRPLAQAVGDVVSRSVSSLSMMAVASVIAQSEEEFAIPIPVVIGTTAILEAVSRHVPRRLTDPVRRSISAGIDTAVGAAAVAAIASGTFVPVATAAAAAAAVSVYRHASRPLVAKTLCRLKPRPMIGLPKECVVTRCPLGLVYCPDDVNPSDPVQGNKVVRIDFFIRPEWDKNKTVDLSFWNVQLAVEKDVSPDVIQARFDQMGPMAMNAESVGKRVVECAREFGPKYLIVMQYAINIPFGTEVV